MTTPGMIQYALVNKETMRVASVVEVPVEDGLTWHYPTDDYTAIASGCEFDPAHDYDDYVYDPETGEVRYDPPPPPEIGYVDLATGEAVSMTSDEFDAMVDEKVRNQVEAVLSELASKAQAEPSVLLSNVGSVVRA